mgnify:CR=1 FL=1
MRASLLLFVIMILIGISLGGCTKRPPVETSSGEPVSAADLVEQGKTAYNKTCIACHNVDPAKDGGIGPAVAGSSRELLEARILKASYPAGYTPKRDSRAMPAQPHLKDDIAALAAYLENK